MYVSKTNYDAYLNSYAYHYQISLNEAKARIEEDPQVLEDYAEYLDNRGY